MGTKMMRIRRKFAVVLCAVCVVIFLSLYFIINYSIPADKQTNLLSLENKLKQLENGFHQHREEMGYLKEKINTMNSDKFNSQKLPVPYLNKKEMIKEQVISADNLEKCSIMTEAIPQPDIQMLELYKEIPFDNPDGGAWKQGWDIQYDPMEFNSHHKLKVFVVPHSHNDPGWIKTVDDYYEHSTKHILSNMLRHLSQNPEMKFIWAEIVYFSKYYESLGENSKMSIKKLVKNRQLEFVTGGWVMTDESNSHWLSILMQLSEGQSWLKTFLNVTPISSWSIDPFGYSPTLPYLLKRSGFENLLIQRAHYSVKKRLARTKELEFRWRQAWDGNGETDLLTHLMPFYSYDIPHTCGPDPKVCCQFDFKRLPAFGLSCPWRVAPQSIDNLNVMKKAELIVDQWKKKSTLYKTRSVLIPLGDDFRFSQSTEWEAQIQNYEKLFDYINNEPSLFTEAKFATLQDYFDSIHHEKKLEEFPSLSGDFFTYADRDDHYWSGYFTSRPYHKRMDRVLLHYIRSAELLFSWHQWEPNADLDKLLTNARRQFSLFQHHDGITGTAKSHVVVDYADRLLQAVKDCKFVIQQATYRLLTKPSIYKPDYKFSYFFLDDSHWPGPDDSRTTIILGEELPTKHIVLHNSLPQWREEIVEFHVSKPYVYVTEFNGKKIPSQISPVWSWHKGFPSMPIPQASTTKYRLIFKAKIPPLGLVTYLINSAKADESHTLASFAKNLILTTSPFSNNLGEYPHQIEFVEPREISLHVGDGPIAAFSKMGFLKSLATDEISSHLPIHLEFVKYGTRLNGDSSGAYLFLPDGPATTIALETPTVLIVQGLLESSVTTGLPFATHQTILRGSAVEIRNLVDIGIRKYDNTEIAMRISTNIKSDDTFYTDLNGLQFIKRKRFGKLPIQANYYPIPTGIYIEDDATRLTLLTAQPLGGSSLKSGQIEIMQDRRLTKDDERGLGQGVLDNQPVLNIFRLVLEKIEDCNKKNPDHPSGFLTSNAFKEHETLLHPADKMIWTQNEWFGAEDNFGSEHAEIENGMQIGVIRNLRLNKTSKAKPKFSTGIVAHRTNLEECTTDVHRGGMLNLKRLLTLSDDTEIYSSLITLLKKDKQITQDDISLCPMDIKAFIIER